MKLQLTPDQTQSYVDRLPVFTGGVNLLAECALVLAEFRIDFDPFTRKDLQAVLNAAGCPEDFVTDPAPWAVVGEALKKYAKPTGQKGYYSAKDFTGARGTPRPFGGLSVPSPAASAQVPSEDLKSDEDSIEIKEVAGIFWSPPAPETLDSLYGIDAGLRRLAVSQSACFGNFSARASACQICPLSSFCAQASLADLPSIVRGLDTMTTESIARAIRDARAPAPSKIDEMLGNATKAPPAPSASTPAPTNLKPYPPGSNEIEVPFEGVCTACKKEVKEGTKGVHVPVKGLFHPDCARGL